MTSIKFSILCSFQREEFSSQNLNTLQLFCCEQDIKNTDSVFFYLDSRVSFLKHYLKLKLILISWFKSDFSILSIHLTKEISLCPIQSYQISKIIECTSDMSLISLNREALDLISTELCRNITLNLISLSLESNISLINICFKYRMNNYWIFNSFSISRVSFNILNGNVWCFDL